MTDMQFAVLCLTILAAVFAGRGRELAQFVNATRSRDDGPENDRDHLDDES